MFEPSRLIEAVFDDEEFREVVGEVADSIGARSFFGGFGIDEGLDGLTVDSGWWSESQIALYTDKYLVHDPCVDAMMSHWQPQQVLDLEQIIGASAFERSVLYQDFIRPMGDDTFRALAVAFELGDGKGAVTFQRGRSDGVFTEEEKLYLGGLAPSLAQLFAARSRVLGLETARRRTGDIIDAIERPILLLKPDGTLIQANGMADDMLKRGKPLSCVGGRIVPADHALRNSFAKVLQEFSRGTLAMRGVRLGDAYGPADDAVVIPQRDGSIMLVLNQVDAPGNAAMLCAIYGLSPGESDVALRLADGETLNQISEARGTSLNTVRQQVRAIGIKMECSRQVDIVRRIAALPRIKWK